MCRLHGPAEPRQRGTGSGPALPGARLPAGLRDALQQPLSLAGCLISAGMSLGSTWFLVRLKLPR